MNIIKQNPFRILGLVGNTTEKELQKQIDIIKRYAEVGKTKSFDYDFEFIGDFTRNSDDIQQASNSIEQAHKKLLYSLFWFVKDNQFDEIAFNNLKENQADKAIEIWNKTLKEEITSKNYSSYHNLSTLYIALSTIDNQIELELLQIGIALKGNLIHSEILKDFSKLVTGNGIANVPIEISKKFVDEVIELLKPYLNKNNGLSTNDLISLFNTYPTGIQKYISSKYTEGPISNIENKIDKTIKKRKDNARNAVEYGEELYKSTDSDINLLKKLMDGSNMQFQMLVNKLANELLECSIVFYNYWSKDSAENFDPFTDTLRIAKYARNVGPSGQAESRVIETIDALEEMRLKGAYKVIAFLNEVNKVFEQVKRESSFIRLDGTRTRVNEEKIMELINPLLKNQIIEIIAKSNKDSLINDFNKSLNKIISYVSYINLDFFKNKRDAFISYLPITNNIKYDLIKSKLEVEINALQKQLNVTKNKKFYNSELWNLESQLTGVKEWHLFRSTETRGQQISEYQRRLNKLITKSETEKKREISRLEEQLVIKRRELKVLTNQ